MGCGPPPSVQQAEDAKKAEAAQNQVEDVKEETEDAKAGRRR
jgi:hypothetical protein